ncbi:acyl-CoA thioesterase [Maribacter chungangensis]|uniref:Acyl-CoA thioesterase n=1 Tax=Maribacter chungangensis TaxID=1069117 RepID=A0ABW3B523_9FLAO
MLANEITFRIRYGETDQMGVVYHGNYAQYLEMGRISWLRALDLSYREMEANGVMLPVVSLEMKFLKPALFDDLVTVKTKLKRLPMVRIEFDYELTNQNNEILLTANTVLAFMDASKKRPIKCPDYIFKKLK